jgi:hypothetical protein
MCYRLLLDLVLSAIAQFGFALIIPLTRKRKAMPKITKRLTRFFEKGYLNY